MKKRKTLKDVADAAGVSKMTASRALRGEKDVSDANVKKVRKVAREIGYFGNHLAASLSSKRSDLIGVVVPALTNVVFPQVLTGITDALKGTGFQPVFGVTDYDSETEYDVLRSMLSWRPSGLIVAGLDQSQDCRELLASADIPIVQIMDTDGDPVDCCVGFSNVKAGSDMAAAILNAGRRRIAYVGHGIDKDTRAAKRHNGFLTELQNRGLEFVSSITIPGSSSVIAGRELVKELIADNPDLDCIYFSNDDLAFGGLSYCIEAGIDVPGSIALIGFNGLELLESFPGKIATSSTHRQQIGEQAAKIIISSLNKPAPRVSEIQIIEPEIILGQIEGTP